MTGWLSQRWTREGRLTTRINRLGATCLILPVSEERTTLESEVLRSARELNEWLEPDRRNLRTLLRAVGAALYFCAILGLFFLSREDFASEAGLFATSLILGCAIAVALLMGETALGRVLAKRRATALMQGKLETFRRGNPLT